MSKPFYCPLCITPATPIIDPHHGGTRYQFRQGLIDHVYVCFAYSASDILSCVHRVNVHDVVMDDKEKSRCKGLDALALARRIVKLRQ